MHRGENIRKNLHDPGCGGFLVRDEILAEECFVPIIRCVNCGWYGFREDEAWTKLKP